LRFIQASVEPSTGFTRQFQSLPGNGPATEHCRRQDLMAKLDDVLASVRTAP